MLSSAGVAWGRRATVGLCARLCCEVPCAAASCTLVCWTAVPLGHAWMRQRGAGQPVHQTRARQTLMAAWGDSRWEAVMCG